MEPALAQRDLSPTAAVWISLRAGCSIDTRRDDAYQFEYDSKQRGQHGHQ